MTTRESIIQKLNSGSTFELTSDELEFIVQNWITMHSQHLSTVELLIETSSPDVFGRVKIDKESIFKHF